MPFTMSMSNNDEITQEELEALLEEPSPEEAEAQYQAMLGWQLDKLHSAGIMLSRETFGAMCLAPVPGIFVDEPKKLLAKKTKKS